jgi:hypothetical protein
MKPGEKAQFKREVAAELKSAADEKRRIDLAELKSELRGEIEKDVLKKEIISELAGEKSKVPAFLQHPVTLLFLGFVLTTGLGTIITLTWKYLEWENEQEYLKTQAQCDRERQTRSEEIKQKYEVKDEIIKRVAETNTAAEEILLYFQMEPARRQKLQEERTKYWQEATRTWRIDEKILKQRLLLRFEDPDVSRLFAKIGIYRGWVGININNQQEKLSTGQKICTEIVNQANLCMSHVTSDLMPNVIEIMNKEILADERNLRAARCTSSGSPETNKVSPTPFTAAANPTGADNNKMPEIDACETLPKMAGICNPTKKKTDATK